MKQHCQALNFMRDLVWAHDDVQVFCGCSSYKHLDRCLLSPFWFVWYCLFASEFVKLIQNLFYFCSRSGWRLQIKRMDVVMYTCEFANGNVSALLVYVQAARLQILQLL